jgi:small subunit ribosomal protein S6
MTRTYEAMFLVNPTSSTKDDNLPDGVRNILSKYDVKILQEKKWAEQKLAYTIKGHKRGSYYLAYFETSPENISKIKQDCELSNEILRILLLSVSQRLKSQIISNITEINQNERTDFNKAKSE